MLLRNVGLRVQDVRILGPKCGLGKVGDAVFFWGGWGGWGRYGSKLFGLSGWQIRGLKVVGLNGGDYPKGPSTQQLGIWELGHSNYSAGFG